MPELDPDAELAIRAGAGDRDSQDEIFRKFRPLMRRWAYARLRREDLVREAVDASIADLFEALGDYDPARGRLRSLAFRITRTRVLMTERSERRHPVEAIEPEMEDTLAYNGLSVERKALGRIALEELSALPEREREAVAAKFLAGFTNDEIGEHVSASERMVRYLQSRGLERLREKLEPFRAMCQCRIRLSPA